MGVPLKRGSSRIISLHNLASSNVNLFHYKHAWTLVTSAASSTDHRFLDLLVTNKTVAFKNQALYTKVIFLSAQ